MKTLNFFSGTGVEKIIISSVVCGSSTIKIKYFDYLRRFINRINEVYDFSIKYLYILLKKHKLYIFLTVIPLNIVLP